jgi:hypothetical protein
VFLCSSDYSCLQPLNDECPPQGRAAAPADSYPQCDPYAPPLPPGADLLALRTRLINTLFGVSDGALPSAPPDAITPAPLATNTSRGQLLRPFPQFTGVSVTNNDGYSNYHSLQTRLERRFSRGYTLMAAYTWSKSIDDVSDVLNVVANDSPNQQNPFDNRNNRAASGFDVPHRLVVTHSYDLPKFSKSNFFMNNVLGGWNLSGIAQTQAGSPVTLVSGGRIGYPIADPLLLGGNGLLRPNLTGTLNLSFAPNPGTVTAANF